jgi:putative FmdB family regulatory protein
MPLYDYRCTECVNRGEVRLSQFDSPMPECALCGAPTERLISAPSGFVMTGGGTYDHGYVSKTAPK